MANSRSKPMLDRQNGSKSMFRIATLSNEQHGFEKTPDAAGAGLVEPRRRSTKVHLGKQKKRFKRVARNFFSVRRTANYNDVIIPPTFPGYTRSVGTANKCGATLLLPSVIDTDVS